MSYDPEKYKDKRDKVLGVKKRTIGFGTLAMIVSVVIIVGLGITAIPQAVTYVTTRNLDDAIFKLDNTTPWPQGVIAQLGSIHGITGVEADKHGTRLVVTFDRTHVELSRVTSVFSASGLTPTLLNRVSHRQRMTAQKQEAMLE